MSALTERHYRAVFDAIDDGFCIITIVHDDAGRPVDYRFDEMNAMFASHTGLTDALGKTVRDFVPQHETFWFEFYDRVLKTGEPAHTEYLAAAMGRWFTAFATRFGPVENKQVAVVFKDITARRLYDDQREELLRAESAARESAEAANRSKDEFLATLSHELRTPLHAMLGWLHMLRENNLTPERRERALATVERNARVQAQLVEDLLDVSRILSGKLRIEHERVDVCAAVEAAIETVRPSAEKKGVTLTLQLEQRAYVLGDLPRLTQVAWNLLSNAVKFTPSGGTVTATVERDGERVQLRVRDTGRGIHQAFLPHVFERFRQEECGSTRLHGGLGLGLSIVQQLVGLHGGEVSVHSDGEGHGAQFRVRLPIAPSATPISEPPPALRRPSAPERIDEEGLHGIDVLVVDDTSDARDMLRALLEDSGARVRVCASAQEALHAFEERVPHVLISDVGMPDSDGNALIRTIRALDPSQGGEVPAIALSAYARREDRDLALRAGFTTHVAKPASPAELLELIVSLTSEPV